MKALDLIHQVMLAILHRRTAMAIEMARNAFVRSRRLF
jgi:1,2-phenylacetyl-CoA epoxidase PaaB subunit